MPFQIVRNDITKMNVDAIVNATNKSLAVEGGVDKAIHTAAGPKLLEECRTLNGCRTGEAKITKGYELPSKYVIHTVGPVWRHGLANEKRKLYSCYRNSLDLALEYQCESIAFPLISSGVHGYPKDKALQVAVSAISDFLLEHDMMVYLVVFGKHSLQVSEKLFSNIARYIDDTYVEAHTDSQEFQNRRRMQNSAFRTELKQGETDFDYNRPDSFEMPNASVGPKENRSYGMPNASWGSGEKSLDEMLQQVDESFSQMVMRKIDEAGMKDSECYKKANIDRKLFSKIRSNVNYKPSKQTAIALAIALELSLPETKNLLMKAGFALSHSNKFDIIIEYFIMHGNYNIFEINEMLFSFDQSLLG